VDVDCSEESRAAERTLESIRRGGRTSGNLRGGGLGVRDFEGLEVLFGEQDRCRGGVVKGGTRDLVPC